MNPILLEKIQNISPQEMAFVFDFDGTITKKYVNDVEVPSIISILRSEGVLNETYSRAAFELKNTYHPIEMDPNVSKEIKFEKVHEWWEKHTELLLANNLTQDDIKKAAHHPKLIIREGVRELFAFAKENEIPVIIFSASGIGTDSIQFFLERYNISDSNILIVSNRFVYNESGVATEQTLPLIHALNKNENTLTFFPDIQKTLMSKGAVLLFGDSPHDVEMVDNKNRALVVRIGLCNEKDAEKKNKILPLFEEKFDDVIENDGSLLPILYILTQNNHSN